MSGPGQCAACGTAIRAGDDFCPRCGTRLPAAHTRVDHRTKRSARPAQRRHDVGFVGRQAACPSCGRTYGFNVDGQLLAHYLETYTGDDGRVHERNKCPGSHASVPLEQTTPLVRPVEPKLSRRHYGWAILVEVLAAIGAAVWTFFTVVDHGAFIWPIIVFSVLVVGVFATFVTWMNYESPGLGTDVAAVAGALFVAEEVYQHHRKHQRDEQRRQP